MKIQFSTLSMDIHNIGGGSLYYERHLGIRRTASQDRGAETGNKKNLNLHYKILTN